ncbi:MAG: hypothetical protein QOE27_2240, partial [Solirubrobacteraceae bacterium]|nr:hypothetical protein [Solirubrobacteraceae bacterium]
MVGGYRVDGLLGEGGMGAVYRATQLSLDRVVALKVLTGELSDDPGFRERFRREGQRQAAIDHPHIVSVYEAGETDEGLFLAMRLIEGPTLKALLLAGEIDHQRCLKVLTQVADALDAAHAVGLIHRDVKPQNILIGARDHAYLADFGLTKGSDDDALLTEPGHFVGTIDYISPEQARGEAASARSDVYSLTCVLHECLTGEVPFPRPSEPSVLFAHLTVAPPSVSHRHPDLPDAVDGVIAKGMAKDPAERYASAGELILEARRAFAAFAPDGSTDRTRMHRIDPAALAAAAAAAAPVAAPADADRVGASPGTGGEAVAAVPPAGGDGPEGGGGAAGATIDAPGAGARAPTRTIATPGPVTRDQPRRPGRPARRPTPAEAPEPARRRGVGGLVAAGLLVALAAAAAGLLLGGSGSSGGGKAPFTNSASVGPLELGFPAAWQRTQEAPQVPGLGLRNPLVLASPQPGTGRLEAGTVAATGPTLLPPALLALLAARPAGEPVRIGALQALRYAGLSPRGLPGGVTLYVSPTSQGVLTLACRPGSAPGATFGADCARVAATARLVGARPYPLGASPVFARQLEAAFTRLSGARRTGQAHLRAAASAAAQAAADRELA